MSKEQENKAIAVRWLEGFWGRSWTPEIVDDLAADDILIQFSLQTPCRGRSAAKNFLLGIREIFQGLEFRSSADLVVDGEYVAARLEGTGTHVAQLIVSPAGAHSWYPKECCHNDDCHPVPCGELTTTRYGLSWKVLLSSVSR